MITQFLSGALCMGFLVGGLFFLRFWRKSRDPLFLMFALSFALFAAEKPFFLFHAVDEGITPLVYLMRLAGFVLIIAAIIQKNRTPRS